MKKQLMMAVVLMIVLPINGCKIFKNKSLLNRTERTDVVNDLKLAKLVADSVADVRTYKYDRGNTTVTERKTIREAPSNDPIELTADFKVDTSKSLKGDTALALTAPGIDVYIIKKPHSNNMTAVIKRRNSKKEIPAREVVIDRTTTHNNDLVDTSKAMLTWRELRLDSIDKSKKATEVKVKDLQKDKSNTPDFWVWVGVAAVVCFFIWLGFRKK